MTPATLIEQVRYRIGLKTDTKLDTQILNALNSVQRESVNMINFQELMVHDKTSLSLSDDTTNYDLPSDFLKMLIVWDNDEYQNELLRIVPTEYKNYLSDVDTTTSTDPQQYDILDSSSNVKQIYLFPLRTSILTGTIASVANYGGTVAGTVLATDAAHGLATGDVITVTTTGGTDYSGTHTITRVSADTFYFTATWVATGTGTWVEVHYVPFVYFKKLADLTASGSANILTTFYEDLYIEGACYYMFRDELFREQPEKIAFRRGEYDRQIQIIKNVQRQPDRIPKVLPKRIIPSIRQLYTTQYQNYSS